MSKYFTKRKNSKASDLEIYVGMYNGTVDAGLAKTLALVYKRGGCWLLQYNEDLHHVIVLGSRMTKRLQVPELYTQCAGTVARVVAIAYVYLYI